jgi:hypothetical protein
VAPTVVICAERTVQPPRSRQLQKLEELISIDLAIAKNCREQAQPNRPRVDGYDGSAAVRVTKKVMAALDSRDLESSSSGPR